VLQELTLLTDEGRAEALADALIDAGALSVAIEDANADSVDEEPLYGEPGFTPERHGWSHSRLRVMLDDAIVEQAFEAAASALGCEAPRIETRAVVADTDWVRATQQQFPPTRISERLWIVPSWHAPPAPPAISVRLDPGVAFGTGTHPTTRLCLGWLDTHLEAGASVLDYGCGSGILAIAAAKLGAATVVGTDIDPQALAAARANSITNGVPASYTEPNALASGTFDVVLANILSNPLKLLAPALLARVASRGTLVLSGVLERQADEVITAYRAADAGLPLAVWRAEDGWVCLAGRRP
jgi:ribosomal protein L11 methyltransferase